MPTFFCQGGARGKLVAETTVSADYQAHTCWHDDGR